MEVLHGDIRITLTDADAIRGMQRTHDAVKRGLAKIDREKAVVNIEANLRDLDKDLIRARREVAKLEGYQAQVDLGLRTGDFEKDIKRARLTVKELSGQKAEVEVELQGEREALAHLHALQAELESVQKLNAQLKEQAAKAAKAEEAASAKRQDALQKEGKMQARAITMDEERTRAQQRASAKRQADLQSEGRLQSRAIAMDDERTKKMQDNIQKEGALQSRAHREMEDDFRADGVMRLRARKMMEDDFAKRAALQKKEHEMNQRAGVDAAKLQESYQKASASYQRLQQSLRSKRLMSEDRRISLEIDSEKAVAEMELARAKLKAMNREPIDIPVDTKEHGLERLANLGNVGTRIGPFSGTLKQFSLAALTLGPILTGLLGTVTALAGAIGTGLAGAVGIAGAALGGFGLTLGGVGFLMASLFRDFKNLNTMQDAYHKQVLKTGADSDKAKTKLQEFNHALGEVTPTTRAAFLSLDKLQDRWRGLRTQAKPDFFNALGSAISTVNADFGLFSKNTLAAFHAVSVGFQGWMKGLRSAEAQNILNTTMTNTTNAIPPLMDSLGHLGAAFGRAMSSFSRYFQPLLADFDAWTAGIDTATQNTTRLNTGVDGLVGSFRDVLGVITAFGRVIIEMSAAAMGPGGDLMDRMASGLNGIADSIKDNPQGLKDFFGESIATTEALYNVLKPLVELFFEFSTILRPATTAVLSIVAPIAQLVRDLTGFGPIRAMLQAFATIWLFKRGTAAAVAALATSVEALAAAFRATGRAAGAAKISSFATNTLRSGSRPIPIPGGAASATEREAAAVAARRSPTIVPLPGGAPIRRGIGGDVTAAANAAKAEEAVAKASRMTSAASSAARGLDALSTGLLGVSGPVALMGAAAVGAVIGLKKLSDAGRNEQRNIDANRKFVGPQNLRDKPAPVRQGGGRFAMAPPGGTSFSDWEKQNEAITKARIAYEDVNNAMRQTGAIQRQMVGIGSQVANSSLMVESAQKAYNDAVKKSGKNSLDARMALQQLRDAQTQETETTALWGEAWRKAHDWIVRGVKRAQDALEASRGTAAESIMSKKLEEAKNQAAAFDVNMRRAKKGVEIFTGDASQKIGAFIRKYGEIPGVKKTLVQVNTEDAALKLTKVIGTLSNLGQRKTVTHILANADNPRQALKELNAALDRWERRHPVAELRADKKDAERKLSDANNALSHYGARKPEARLKARDEAQAKLDKLNKQLDELDGKDATVTAHVKFTLPSSFKTDAAGGYGGSGDGQGVPNIKKGIQKFAENHPKEMSDMFLGAGGLGNTPAPGKGLNAFNGIATRFGLTVGSGFRENAITSAGNLSYHAMGRARDFPGAPGDMMRFARFMAATFGSRLKELIYTPLGWSIKDGQRVPPYAQADHYDHVHVAMAQGGERPRSGRYTQPTVLFAEETNHPEYFISTNPRDRKRSQKLITQAAADTGMLEHSPMFYAQAAASGGARGKGLGSIKSGGNRLTSEQQRILQTALAMAKAYGAPARATGALIEALFAESGARNLRGGDASSTGPLQLLASTAKGLGINPRDTKAVIKAFLTKGFTGKGGAIALAKNKRLSAAEIATRVQGNRDGASTYTAFKGMAARVLHAVNFKGGAGSLIGGHGGARDQVVAVHGATNTLANRLAASQGALDWATGTAGYGDDIRAIYGRDRTVLPPRATRGGNVTSIAGRLGKNGRGRVVAQLPRAGTNMPRTVHDPGMIDLLHEQNKGASKRLGKINSALKGRLTPARRATLLQQKEAITGTLTGNRTKIRDLQKQGLDARFERNMGKSTGNRSQIDSRTALAESTVGLDDDLAAAQAEANYQKAKVKWANKHGDKAAATEAQNALNTATQKMQSITDDIRSQKFSGEESWIGWVEGQASLTGTLSDDFTAATDALSYWQGRVTEAQGRGDTAGAYAAGASVQQYTERVKSLKEDMVRLPLERDAALAALTDDTEDDKKATIALRDYWKTRLDTATQENDAAGQIEAANNLKTYNDQIKAAEESIVTQMVLLSSARRDLLTSFGSNFIQGVPVGTPVGVAPAPPGGASAGTVVNLTVNGADLAPDPFTWSQNVSWELQAAV